MTDILSLKHSAVTPDERLWLKDQAALLPDDALIVHIGVDRGVSLHCSRAGNEKAAIIGVDLTMERFQGEQDAYMALVQGDSGKMKPVKGYIDFLFIDGDHSAPAVWADLENWLPLGVGVVALHDYGWSHLRWCAGVKAAVDAWDWMGWDQIDAPDSIRAYRGIHAKLGEGMKRRGDDFGSIAIGTPYYRPVYEFFRWWTWLLLGGLEDGDACLNTFELRCEVPIPLAHNGLVKEFLKTSCDTLLIVEDDHVGDQQTIRRMRNKEENWDFDIVCASYTNRRNDAYMAIGGHFVEGDVSEYGEYNCLIEPLKAWRTGTQPYDYAALGCVLIRRWVIEKMLGDNDPEEYFWFDWRGRNSQDITFYARVKELTGARVGVDRDNDIGHIGKKVFTMREFWTIWDNPKVREAVENG